MKGKVAESEPKKIFLFCFLLITSARNIPYSLNPEPEKQNHVKRAGQHSLEDKGAGGANSNDWRESLALCILWECHNMNIF
jgi:hypothetical protein